MTATIKFFWPCPICDTETDATKTGPKTVKVCKRCGYRSVFDGNECFALVRGAEFRFKVESGGAEFTRQLLEVESAINNARRIWQSKRPVKTRPVIELQLTYIFEHEVVFRRRHSDNVITARTYALTLSRRQMIQNWIDRVRVAPDIHLFESGIMLIWNESKF